MGVLLATVLGLVIWIVGWAVGGKAFDWFMLGAAIVVVAATARIAVLHLPGRAGEE